MAGIRTTDFSFTSDANPQMVVSITLDFMPREVSDNYVYGVNIAVVRDRPGQVVYTRHKGHRALEIGAIPPDVRGDMVVGSTSLTVTPNGNATMTFSVNVPATWPIASGERLQALVTVVPEIAETINFSQPMTFP